MEKEKVLGRIVNWINFYLIGDKYIGEYVNDKKQGYGIF